MTAAEHIAQFLEARGVRQVFELSGGYITHLLDAINRRGAVRVVSMHHEQSAAFAADAVGRTTGIPGVALATSGPGATNLVTGIASCHFDSSPAVFITGQVHRRDRKGERPIRQLGFQETDIVSIVRPITKAAWQVQDAADLPEALERAFRVATDGRPGPVLIDLPLDVQYAEVGPPREGLAPAGAPESSGLDAQLWEELFGQLEGAEWPLIWAGGGVRAARATALAREFARRVRVPVACSLMAVDALPADDPLRVGFIGAYGNRWANLAAGRSDFILVLGARLDIRQTGSEARAFKGERTIFHVDCEAGEINNRVEGCRAVVADVNDFLSAALERARGRELPDRAGWLAEIAQLRRTYPATAEAKVPAGINPNALMEQLSSVSEQAAAYVVDVGQHQMWAAQSLQLREDQAFLTSGGLGSMGFALPAAIGAGVVLAPRPVVVVAGDGGFQCNIQELETVVRNGLPLKIVVVDNGCHGMTRQFQGSFFGGRYQSSLWGYSAPDFARVAGAYGIPAASVEDPAQLDTALRRLWEDPASPALLRVGLDTYTDLYPKIAFGRPITEMEPLAEPVPDWDVADAESPGSEPPARRDYEDARTP